MRNKKNVIMVVMLVAVALMSMGYALFATQLNINSTGNITSTWSANFESISSGTAVGGASNASTPSVSGTSANMNVNLNLPGDSMTYSLVFKNTGSVGVIIQDVKANATGSSAIIYSISGIKVGDKLAVGASKTITIKIEYDPNTTSQPSETSKQLTIIIDAVQDIGQTITSQTPSVSQPLYLSSAILKDNTAQADTSINFAQSSSSTNGQGLYYTSTNTEDNKTTYYFRGNVENNYVQFGGEYGCVYNGQIVKNPVGRVILDSNQCSEVCTGTQYGTISGAGESYCELENGNWTGESATWQKVTNSITWRILRINEDGSIRLIQDKVPLSQMIEYNVSESGKLHAEDNAYVGYMYGTPGSLNYADTHKNVNSSTVKTYLDSWYETHLASYSSYIADPGFCNDRSIFIGTGIGGEYTRYNAFYRYTENQKPEFKCPQENDLFTTSASSKGNGALTYSIGLITMDEVMYIDASSNSYLFEDYDYWFTMSPYMTENYSYDEYADYDASASIYYVDTMGGFGSRPTGLKGMVRPVINLKSDVAITSGNGTVNNPYIIKLNK